MLVKPTKKDLEEKLSSGDGVMLVVENTKYSDRPFLLKQNFIWVEELKKYRVWSNFGQYPTHQDWGRKGLKKDYNSFIGYQKDHRYLKISIPYESEFDERIKKEKLKSGE